MPHKPKYPRATPAEEQDYGEIFRVICPRCGKVFYPDPNKWRNIDSVLSTGVKDLHCPNCNKLIVLRKEHTRWLMLNARGHKSEESLRQRQ
jgi:uncharacterized C2H2 Zn-finger protein